MPDTETQYHAAQNRCRTLFLAKAQDYGTSWRVLRLPSVTDQLFIKAKRIRTLEETGENRVGEGIEPEFIGLVNYSVIALLVAEGAGAQAFETTEPSLDELAADYDRQTARAFTLFQAKNHDYGEAWRDMRLSSYTDLILAKLLRIKQLEAKGGPSKHSEGVEAGYLDILNYALFALIRLSEGAETS